MTNKPWWPEDYFASRDQFVEQSRLCGASLTSYPVSQTGPGTHPLTIDVAALTSPSDEYLIVLTSGVHGVEGFLGASIQIKALQALQQNGLPKRTGIIMVHAVNPWGYAHLRRVNEHNIDINRNFFSTLPQSHPNYAPLNPVINLQSSPNLLSEINYWCKAGGLIVRNRGIGPLFKAIAAGQYDYPNGVFYGGITVSESCKHIKTILRQYTQTVQRIAVLDIHTGLGRSAIASLIGNTNMGKVDGHASWISKHFSTRVYIDTDTKNTYTASGTFSQWCQQTFNNKEYLYLCVEIGTVNPITLFSALRRENQAHHWADHKSKSYVQTKQALRDVFAPRSDRWRARSIKQGLQVIDRTLNLPKHLQSNQTYF